MGEYGVYYHKCAKCKKITGSRFPQVDGEICPLCRETKSEIIAGVEIHNHQCSICHIIFTGTMYPQINREVCPKCIDNLKFLKKEIKEFLEYTIDFYHPEIVEKMKKLPPHCTFDMTLLLSIRSRAEKLLKQIGDTQNE